MGAIMGAGSGGGTEATGPEVMLPVAAPAGVLVGVSRISGSGVSSRASSEGACRNEPA